MAKKKGVQKLKGGRVGKNALGRAAAVMPKGINKSRAVTDVAPKKKKGPSLGIAVPGLKGGLRGPSTSRESLRRMVNKILKTGNNVANLSSADLAKSASRKG